MELRIRCQLMLAIIFHALIRSSSASVSYPSIQAIIGFSSSCTLAYSTPVNNCDLNDFRAIGGTGSCSAKCQSSLETSQRLVQRLCSGEKADGSSLIGQLFVGNVVNFLCGNVDTGATLASTTQETTEATQTSTFAETSMSSTASSETSTTETSSVASTLTTSLSATASATKTTSSTSESTNQSSSTSSESTTSTLTSTSSSSESSSTSSAASSSRAANSQVSGGGSGGGSPFDGTFSSAASSHTLQLHGAILVFAALTVLLLEAW
ncbi:hypothetical protein Z517_01354 [Fonsecaea pedrosoi CBS 271.37]|uniref:Extracellular membrane protein CFEM domain-containing protein n=1 Tax=Fonsecaea pedrosoi CBS 271.37 TaxID=1442368 RepID=A0A0D2H518_9EURO|nr:uncharacterized protein Z517_01354 [Fonsecaea pedrosoi CBS 271.37]KIW85960.1 hypothetical protein Z517_01354 [Fonsecaea pedrosoi CBS 271.37]